MGKITAKVVYDKLISDILPDSDEKTKLTGEKNIFVNLTGPAREHFLGKNWKEGQGKKLEATLEGGRTLTVNILSQKDEGELERADFIKIETNNEHITRVKQKVPGYEDDKKIEVWSFGGSSTQLMKGETGIPNVLSVGAMKNVITSDSDEIKQLCDVTSGEKKLVILYNAIGHQVGMTTACPKKGYHHLSIVQHEDGYYDGAAKIIYTYIQNKITKEEAVNDVVIVGRKEEPPLDASHLTEKYNTLKGDDTLFGVEISSGQIKTYDGAEVAYLYQKGNVVGDDPMKVFETELKKYDPISADPGPVDPATGVAADPGAGAEGTGNPANPSTMGGARRRRNRKSRKNKAKKSRKARSRSGNSARKSRRGRGRGRGRGRRTRRN